MAKRKKSNNSVNAAKVVDSHALPQNIRLVGEQIVEGSKSVYISQPVYKTIHRFAVGKTKVESGGVLVGYVIEEFGKSNVIITGFIEAKFTEATASTLKFTHETWAACHKEIAKKYSGQKIIGWIHTHPDFGIFLSEYDKFIQENFFKEEYQVAYVVDPIQNIEGFYTWENGSIERNKGFFIFDKMGVGITAGSGEIHHATGDNARGNTIRDVALAISFVLIFALFLYAVNLSSENKRLQNQQETIVNSANQSLGYMQQQLDDLRAKIEQLQPSPTGDSTDGIEKIPSESDNATDEEKSDQNDGATATDITP